MIVPLGEFIGQRLPGSLIRARFLIACPTESWKAEAPKIFGASVVAA